MGKKEKSSEGGLGRALVRHHNQMVRKSKEKGIAIRDLHRRQNPVLESFTEVSAIDAIIEAAATTDVEHSGFDDSGKLPSAPINLGPWDDGMLVITAEERKKQQKEEEALHASSLRVPRRPPWMAEMSTEELDANERKEFLAWRRSLARLEENEKLVVTPFEKNLDIWRQLWRVVERSDLLVMVVDARDPLFYRCPDLEAYAKEIDEHNRTLLLVNKADLLPVTVRQRWATYFRLHGFLFVFWSAKAASAALEGKPLSMHYRESASVEGSISDADTKIYGREELLIRLQAEAVAIVSMRNASRKMESVYNMGNRRGSTASKHAVVGFVGYPNVGKSSTINALVGEKRTGVTSTPGKTKHFQTLIISDELMLCDCPGLVFPSFSSSRYEMVASGVLPIDRMTEHREAVQVVANRVSRHVLETIYNISLPKPKAYELQGRPPLSSELLRAYCSSRGYVSSSGLPDETRAARQILKDYIDGKLPHFEMPPGMDGNGADLDENFSGKATVSGLFVDGKSDKCNSVDHTGDTADGSCRTSLDLVLQELESFETAARPSSAATGGGADRKATTNKHHKKPQRKKNRSWRVQNDDADGMPLVRVFHKLNMNPCSAQASVQL